MPVYYFSGYPAYLKAAAAEIGCPEAADPARRIAALAAVANLCSQASVASLADVPAILSKAGEACNHLRVAHRAAELMLIDVQNGRGISPATANTPPNSPPEPQRRPKASRPSA